MGTIRDIDLIKHLYTTDCSTCVTAGLRLQQLLKQSFTLKAEIVTLKEQLNGCDSRQTTHGEDGGS
jgi:hypothetical protein